MHIPSLSLSLSLLLPFTAAAAALQGFNYGSTNPDGSCRRYSDFKTLFQRAQHLTGTSTFTAAHLYTSIQCGTTDAPTEAFRAAVDTNTKLVVGLWASSTGFDKEMKALMAVANNKNVADQVVAISVGSEDLYRNSPQGKANGEGVGASAEALVGYIGWLRDWLKGSLMQGKKVMHADTWSAWVLPENKKVIEAVDVLGHNSFPYFEDTRPDNSIDRASDNFWQAVAATEAVAMGKPVWITETGWPVSGPKRGKAIASIANAKKYWHTIGCSLFGKRNTFWYTLADVNVAQTQLSFGVTPVDSATPKFDLRCS
ncbi:glycoside hydrolase family 17 protein [Poronia punctata]|nr:glycoside hydrolase family 17 protein [Poronia punctata]